MPLKQRLFERLQQADKFGLAPRGNETEQLIQSVEKHLRHILNTRQGSVPMDLNFGVPEIRDLPLQFASPETETIQKIIRGIIEKYESRLSDVEITYQGTSPDGLSMRFGLTASLKTGDKNIPVHFQTGFAPGNTFSVSMK
jgi:type VI secretion system protein